MQTRIRTSRWLERAAWTALGMSLIGWIVGNFLTISAGNEAYQVHVYGGFAELTFAQSRPDYSGGFGAASSEPMTIAIEKLDSDAEISDRLGLELPSLVFDVPIELVGRLPFWFTAICSAALALRLRRTSRVTRPSFMGTRRFLSRCCVVFSVLSICLWVVTRVEYDLHVDVPFFSAFTHLGTVNVRTTDLQRPDVTLINRSKIGYPIIEFGPHAPLRFDGSFDAGWSSDLARFPAWLPALMFLPLAIGLHRSARFVPAGHCTKCGYDLTGNESGKCSECGRVIVKQVPGTRQ